MAMSQVCRRIVIVGAFSRSPHTGIAVPGTVPVYGSKTPVKRHRGEPGHTRDTRDTRAHAGIRITRTNLTTIHPNPKTQTRTKTATDSTEPQEQPQARSRPLPAADSEEAAPGEPDPASTHSQSASPRLLEGGRRNEGARGRCVTAGGAARAPDELKTREAETGVSDGPVLYSIVLYCTE